MLLYKKLLFMTFGTTLVCMYVCMYVYICMYEGVIFCIRRPCFRRKSCRDDSRLCKRGLLFTRVHLHVVAERENSSPSFGNSALGV